jgi:membrane peptidoglycan carboxypeptidase
VESAALRRAAHRRAATRRTVLRLVAKDRARKARRRRVLVAVVVALVMGASGVAVGAYYVDRIPTPDQLALPESTTIYFSDGRTAMARLGTENRTILAFDEMNDAVKQAIVAAEDRSFWTHGGVDLTSVLRAAWNNLRGGRTQGASTITQQYARIAADLEGVTYARKAREALLAWKMDNRFSKEEILEFYLNTVPFDGGPTASRRPRRRSSARRCAAAHRPRSRSRWPRRWCWRRWSSSPSPTRTTPRTAPATTRPAAAWPRPMRSPAGSTSGRA